MTDSRFKRLFLCLFFGIVIDLIAVSFFGQESKGFESLLLISMACAWVTEKGK